MKQFIFNLLSSKKFYISLFFPIFIILLLLSAQSDKYVGFLGFFLGLTSLPLILTILEIKNPDKWK